jgi:hypothetical protein
MCDTKIVVHDVEEEEMEFHLCHHCGVLHGWQGSICTMARSLPFIGQQQVFGAILKAESGLDLQSSSVLPCNTLSNCFKHLWIDNHDILTSQILWVFYLRVKTYNSLGMCRLTMGRVLVLHILEMYVVSAILLLKVYALKSLD